jgi:cyclopropane fatty-acyl-phospholipid synthase-like methyltransferase/methyltransferase-like protein
MPEDPRTIYDEVLYGGHSYSLTHPDHLATLGHIFGLEPKPADQCRVLEIGCGEGANLIPMAYGLPRSEFSGIDLAARPIAAGQAWIRKLGLQNITLLPMDLVDCPGRFSPFDYIVVHGVYSWVPPAVQDRLLEVCRELLLPGGIAFVSYNTYPGCYIRQMLREMMLFHVDQAPDPETRLNQARAFCGLLVNARHKTDAYDQLIRHEIASIQQRRSECLYHDDLAEVNRPVYFHQFMEQAARHGLRFLAEAEYFMMQDADLTEAARDAVRGLDGNRLLKEQYLDFLRGRRFRQTLLCRQDAPVQDHPVPDRIRQLRIESSASAASATLDVTSAGEETFHGPNGATMICSHPVAKAAMQILIEAWPRSLAFPELVRRVEDRLDVSSPGNIDSLVTETMWPAYRLGVVEFHMCEPRFALTAGERPETSLVARLQAARGELVTNLRHQVVRLSDERDRRLLQWLDGTRDRKDLALMLEGNCDNAEGLDESLSAFGRMSLLL